MVSNLRSRLQALSNDFLLEDKAKGKMVKGSQKESAKVKTESPNGEPYTYLMALLVMHCPSLMTAANYCPMDKSFFVEMYEWSS